MIHHERLLMASIMFSALVITSCSSTQDVMVHEIISAADKAFEAISTADKAFMESFNQGDAAAVAALYAEDGKLLPPNSDFITGREAIQAFWKGAMDMGIKSAKLEIIEAGGLGDTAYELGKYTLLSDGGEVLDAGKYIVVWKQVNGQWKLHRDIWNSSMPAPKQQ